MLSRSLAFDLCSRPSARAATMLVVGLLLAGCGGSERKGDSQIAAIVNDGEISVHQVQVVLQRQPRLAALEGGTAATRALDGLVDQELGAQAARAASLDKDPRVVQRLEAAKREILAQAWQESVAANVRSASSDEVDRYYAQHPNLFSQRRLYLLQETSLDGTPEQLEGLADKVAQSASVEELGLLLHRIGVRTQSRTLAQAAEDLPMGLLDRVAPLEQGRSFVAVQGGHARIYTLLQAHKAPAELRQATGAIAAYLANERRGEAVAAAMKDLRAAAKVEYLGNFARAAAAASAP
jgi:EpsD family peptidyl-prolyl cis-trans isomerase